MRAIFLVLLGASSVAVAADVADGRAAELARARREVETLSADVELRKEDLRAQLKAIDAQKLEIAVQIRREELRLAQVEGEAEARRAALALESSRGDTLAPALLSSILEIREGVAAGLPFRVPERIGELDRLRGDLEGGLVAPEAATARLWAFVEDELRLVRENGLDRQVVTVNGEELLADVARLGMVALYFRTEGGVVGTAVPRDGTWTWTALSSRDDRKQVEALFEKLRHGVRSGAFSLPNPAVAR